GAFQHPEKLIPLTIVNAVYGKPLPIYGDGSQIRDWLLVDDHVAALQVIGERSQPGETYNIGGGYQAKNINVVRMICDILNHKISERDRVVNDYASLITFVEDRAGHDKRYAVDGSKLLRDFGWKPRSDFQNGLSQTVDWYLSNIDWCVNILKKSRSAEN
ncbi:GDP-mannose 4,6-dehydratase, partial [bacterium]|nr:GDP-mannose 4,6-dehydratase [bacterium]